MEYVLGGGGGGKGYGGEGLKERRGEDFFCLTLSVVQYDLPVIVFFDCFGNARRTLCKGIKNRKRSPSDLV